VNIAGSILKNDPNLSDARIVNVVVRDIDNQGKVLTTFERRTNIKKG
jgi:hypothetical protein